jgi:hypothetical protein
MEAETREELEKAIRNYLRWVRRHANVGLFVEAFQLNPDRLRTLFGRNLVGAAERERIRQDMMKAI